MAIVIPSAIITNEKWGEQVEKLGECVLITGGAGFIGYHLIQKLLEKTNYRIICIDNMNSYYDTQLKEYRITKILNKIKFIRGDLCDEKLINRIISDYKPTTIIHLAAQAGVRYSITNPKTYIESNVIGFYNIIESIRSADNDNFKQLIYASSSSVYGSNEKIPYSVEDKTDSPVSLYAATKKCDEILAHSYSSMYGIPCTGLRFFTVYGPAGRPDMAYYKFTKQIINGEKIELYNYGNSERDFTYVDDVTECITKIIDHPPANITGAPCVIYNIGNDRPVKLKDFVKTIELVLKENKVIPDEYKIEDHVVLVPKQIGDVISTHADIEKTKLELGYSPQTTINDGLKKFIKWYIEYHSVKKA